MKRMLHEIMDDELSSLYKIEISLDCIRSVSMNAFFHFISDKQITKRNEFLKK